MPKPFVKWVGGKTSLLPALLERTPYNINTYFEPFVGGGALYFALRHRKACLSDINEELINLYSVIKTDVDNLIEELNKHEQKIGYRKRVDYYYELRNMDRKKEYKDWTLLERAARTLYLNKTCWNGLYRVNSKGYFNVPYGGGKSPLVIDESNLRSCSIVLQDTIVNVLSFEWVEDVAKKGDFVYFDPPYVPLDETSFTSYTKEDFGKEDQIKLKEICDQLNRNGVSFMLSNSHTEFILDLYKAYRIDVVYAPRAINSKGDGRGKIKEVLVMNYEPKTNKDWWEIGVKNGV